MSERSATDEFLAFRATGDPAALERALVAVRPRLLRCARSSIGRSQDALDLVQDALLIAVTRAGSFRGETDLAGWLCGIVRNLARRRRSRAASRTAAVDRELALESTPPDQAALARELRTELREAVAALRSPYREVVAVYVDGETSPTAIAAQLGRTPSTVRTQLDRGLRKLREIVPRSLAPLVIACLVAQRVDAAARVPDTRPRRVRAAVGAVVMLLTGFVSFAIAEQATAPLTRDAATARPSTRIADAVTEAERTVVAEPDAAAARVGTVVVGLRWANEDEPAIGVSVVLEVDARPGTRPIVTHDSTWRRGVTDAGGEVRFVDVPPGPVQLRLDDATVRDRITVRAGGTHRIETRIRSTFTIDGTVVDDAGVGIVGAQIWVTGTSRIMTPGFVACVSGANGAFRAPVFVARRPFEMWAERPGVGMSSWYRPKPDVPRLHQKLVVRAATRRIVGSLVGPGGRGVPGIVALYPMRTPDCAPPPTYTRTEADGRFRIPAYALRYRLAATAAGLAGTTAELDARDHDVEGLVLRLSRGVEIRGRVVGIDDADPSPYRVVARSPRPTSDVPEQFLLHPTAALAADGTFRVGPFRPGQVVVGLLDLSAARRPVDSLLLDVPNRDVLRRGVLRCELSVATAARWHVRVVAPENRLDRRWVAVASSAIGASRRGVIAVVPTDAAGLAKVAGLTGDPVDVLVFDASDDALPVAVVHAVVPGNELAVELPHDATLGRCSGQLVSTATGGKLATLRLRRADSDAAHSLLLPVGESEFEFERVPPGDYALELLGRGEPRAASLVARVRVESGEDVALGRLVDRGWGVVKVRAAGLADESHLPIRIVDHEDRDVVRLTLRGAARRTLQLPTTPCAIRYVDANGRGQAVSVLPSLATEVDVDLQLGPGRPVRLVFRSDGGVAASRDAVVKIGRSGIDQQRIMRADYLGRNRFAVTTDLAPGVFDVEFAATWCRTSQHRFVVADDPRGQEIALPVTTR